jgi:hypothetical protein
MTHIYPPDLFPLIATAWQQQFYFPEEERPPLPAEGALRELLALAYHTSLLREEGRKLAFRILVLPREKSKKRSDSPRRTARMAEFTEPRSLTIAELRRLAPAADSIRSMICVDHDEKLGWVVWGLLDTGANWWEFTHHEANSGTPPPSNIAIASPGPGELVISSAGFVLLSLRSGATYVPKGDVLSNGPVSDHLEPARRSLYRDAIRRIKAKKWDMKGNDNDYPKRFHDMCLSRILSSIREMAHGGTLILVPDELSVSDSRLTDRINIKHPCNYDYAWGLMIKHFELFRQYYDLYFPLWDAKKPIPPKDFRAISMIDSQREENDEALRDCFRFIASLSAVDGALVVTDRFRVLGFGAEVVAQSQTLKEIRLAITPDATETKCVSIEAYGTRHRSAFRFCSSYENSIAFIVSSDGGIKATKRIGSNVVLWPEVQAGHHGA